MQSGPAVRLEPPPRESAKVLLRLVTAGDYDFLYALEQGSPFTVFYRYRGTSVAPDQYIQALWKGVLVNLLVVDKSSGVPIGLLSCYSADFRNGHARLNAVFVQKAHSTGLAIEASDVFLDYIFRTFPLRKLYGEVMEWNEGLIGAFRGQRVREEGRLLNHEFHDGRYYDLVIYAIYREGLVPSRELSGAVGDRAAYFKSLME